MPIDAQREHLLTINQAARRLPNQPHPSTVWRWVLTGLSGGAKLESVKIGGKRYTSVEAVDRFIAGATAAGEPVPPRSPCQRERDIARAERELEDQGV